MHILPTSSATLDDLIEPVDLRQEPADIVCLSFSDSDLSGIATAWSLDRGRLPSMRLAALRDLRHPMSVDLWIDRVARHARIVLVRILGGYEWWRYGCDQLAALAREKHIKLALLPGECREEDLRLVEGSTLPRAELDALLDFFREGGPDNMRGLVRRLGAMTGMDAPAEASVAVPKAGFYQPGVGVVDAPFHPPPCGEGRQENAARQLFRDGVGVDHAAFGPTPHSASRIDPPHKGEGKAPIVPILFYRSMLLSADVESIDVLTAALRAKGIAAVPIFVASLKDRASVEFVERAIADLRPSAIVTATAFASGAEPGGETLFDRVGVPVFQVIVATTRKQAWESNQRGLAPADLAMHVVLPELDGRILAGAISFKAEREIDPALGFRAAVNEAQPDRVEQVAARIAAMLHLQRTPPAERRLAILMPDYPAAAGRTGYAVGLDVPNSVLAMLHDLKDAGYAVDGIPETARDLLDALDGGLGLSVEEYLRLAESIPNAARDAVEAAWGKVSEDLQSLRSFTAPSVLPDISPTRGRLAASASAIG